MAKIKPAIYALGAALGIALIAPPLIDHSIYRSRHKALDVHTKQTVKNIDNMIALNQKEVEHAKSLYGKAVTDLKDAQEKKTYESKVYNQASKDYETAKDSTASLEALASQKILLADSLAKVDDGLDRENAVGADKNASKTSEYKSLNVEISQKTEIANQLSVPLPIVASMPVHSVSGVVLMNDREGTKGPYVGFSYDLNANITDRFLFSGSIKAVKAFDNEISSMPSLGTGIGYMLNDRTVVKVLWDHYWQAPRNNNDYQQKNGLGLELSKLVGDDFVPTVGVCILKDGTPTYYLKIGAGVSKSTKLDMK